MAGLGVPPAGVRRVLELANELEQSARQGASYESRGFRFSMCKPDRITGEPLGRVRGYVVTAWTITPR